MTRRFAPSPSPPPHSWDLLFVLSQRPTTVFLRSLLYAAFLTCFTFCGCCCCCWSCCGRVKKPTLSVWLSFIILLLWQFTCLSKSIMRHKPARPGPPPLHPLRLSIDLCDNKNANIRHDLLRLILFRAPLPRQVGLAFRRAGRPSVKNELRHGRGHVYYYTRVTLWHDIRPALNKFPICETEEDCGGPMRCRTAPRSRADDKTTRFVAESNQQNNKSRFAKNHHKLLGFV